MGKIDDLGTWKTFVEVVRTGGVHAACDTLRCEPSTVSRALKAIELELGAPVFRREGRQLRLTTLGIRAHERAQALLAEHRAMIEELRGDRDRLSGKVRLAANAGITATEITPSLVEFRKVYPEIEFELVDLNVPIPEIFRSTEQPLVDIALGYGPHQPLDGLVSRYLGDMPFICCASLLYVKQYGRPVHPSEARSHTGLVFEPMMRRPATALEHNGLRQELVWKQKMTFKNLLSARSAVLLGAGIMPDLPLFHAAEALRSGEIVPVMEGWRTPSGSCFVFATQEAYERRRVRLLLEWLADTERKQLERLRAEFPQFYG